LQSLIIYGIIDRVLSLGYGFVSADYRLLIPTTTQEIVEDIQDAFKFVAHNELPGDGYIFKLDGDRIAVAGNSSGGLCARLAAIHARPRPKVLIDIYGQGGNFFVNHSEKIFKCEHSLTISVFRENSTSISNKARSY